MKVDFSNTIIDGKVQKGLTHLIEIWQYKICGECMTNQWSRDIFLHVQKHGPNISYKEPLSKYFKTIVGPRKGKG
jgi:hypothetical protein